MDMFFFPEIMRKLIGAKAKVSGVFVRIKGIGYFFYLGLSMDTMASYSVKVLMLYGLEICPICSVKRKSARIIMAAIHKSNDRDRLPGYKKYLETQREIPLEQAA